MVADTVGDRDFEVVAAGIQDEEMMLEDLLYGKGEKFTCKNIARRVKIMRGSIDRTERNETTMYQEPYF